VKILACVSEQFFLSGDIYGSKPTSIKFLQNAFGVNSVVAVSPVSKNIAPSKAEFSSEVSVDCFEEVPNFNSIKEFVKKSIFSRGFFRGFVLRCNNILDKYPSHTVWCRNPSIGSLIFSICTVRKGRPLINHMCANAMNGWKNDKYTIFEKVVGYFFSKVISIMVSYVSSKSTVVNLCTGDELLRYCLRKNKNSYQFVDVMVERKCEKLLLNHRGTEFLFVGRLEEDKGISDLCEVIYKINAKNEAKIMLTIVGGGSLLESLKKKYTSNIISFVGQVANEDLDKYFLNSRVVIIPSKNYYEGFPRVIMEAWSNYLPVIVSDTGGVKAFVKNNENGILFKMNDKLALERAIVNIQNTTLYETLKTNSKKMAGVSTQSYWISELRKIIKESNFEK